LVREGKDGRQILVRRAILDDVPRVIDNWQGILDERKYIATGHVSDEQKERFKTRVNDNNVLLAVAEVDGKVVGHLSLGRYSLQEETRHVLYLDMGVVDGYRETGVGTALMDFAVQWARERRVGKITLSVFSTNTRALKLYEKFGYEVEGVRRRQFVIDGSFVDEILMGLFLSS